MIVRSMTSPREISESREVGTGVGDEQRVSLSDAAASDLRTRLTALRADALRQLAEAAPIVDCGLLALIAHAGETLAALESEICAAAQPKPGARALVVIDDNQQIRVVVY